MHHANNQLAVKQPSIDWPTPPHTPLSRPLGLISMHRCRECLALAGLVCSSKVPRFIVRSPFLPSEPDASDRSECHDQDSSSATPAQRGSGRASGSSEWASNSADQFLNNVFGNQVAYVDSRNGDLDVFVTSFTFVPDDLEGSINSVIEDVRARFDGKVEKKLVKKLEKIIKEFNKGNLIKACKVVGGVIKEVKKLIFKVLITEDEGKPVIDSMEDIDNRFCS